MIDQKRIAEAEKNVKRYLDDDWLLTKRKDMVQHCGFFMKNAETSLITANTLFEISNEPAKKKILMLSATFESYLWVVVSAYYSMFYAALALLAKHEIKVGGKVHQVVSDTLVANFLKNQKLAKLLDAYEDAKDEALQLVGTEERAEELIANYERERQKRNDLQYELGCEAKQNLAKTSLERATKFVAEVRNILRL